MSSNITKRLEMNKRTSQFGSGFRWYRYRVNFANLYWNLCIASNLVPIVPSISQKLATPFPGLHGRFIYQAWLLLLCRVRVNCIAGVGAVEVSRRSVDRVAPLPGWAVTLLIAVLVSLLTEITSNTAVVTVVTPIIIAMVSRPTILRIRTKWFKGSRRFKCRYNRRCVSK